MGHSAMYICDPSAQNQSQVDFLRMMHHLKEKEILFTMT